MKTWQVDDKEWMKQRKAKWKDIKKRLKRLTIETKDTRYIKQYFLTGEQNVDYPVETINVGALLEMWLHPDHSLARWEELRTYYLNDKKLVARYWDSVGDFARIAGSRLSHPEHIDLEPEESFFDGLEEQFFQFFKLDDLAEGREWSKAIYLKKAQTEYSKVGAFHVYLSELNPNPYHILRWKIPYWHQAMLLACEEVFPKLERLIEELCDVLNNPEGRHPLVLEMAHKIDKVLKDPELKPGVKERINELRQQYGCG